MKGNVLRRMLSVMLAMLLVTGMFSGVKAEAKEITFKTPKIKVKTTSDSVKITINKTKDAEGYEVVFNYVPDAGYQELYEGADTLTGNWSNVVYTGKDASGRDIQITLPRSGQVQNTIKIEQDGKKKRTVTLKPVPAGKFTITVRSYNVKKFGTKRYSDYCKEKTVTIKYKAPETVIGYKSKYDFSSVKEGDTILFGSYEQDNDFANGYEPIEWIVLEKTKKSMLVVSKYALDAVPYNIEKKDVTWETCTLRKWLNDKFYSVAFNKTEQDMIKKVTLENFDNPIYNTPGGNDTKDKVFLLSMFDMRNMDYGFSDSYGTEDQNRRCGATVYAKAAGVYTNSSYKTKDGENACYWWLRSPGPRANGAAYVNCYGTVYDYGGFVSDDILGVRPALYINLNP